MTDNGARRETGWWTLSQVVDWVREIDPSARVGDIRLALVSRCASGRIRTHGHRRLYAFGSVLPIDHNDPTFIWFAEQHGRLEAWFDEISADEWRDLAFFARPTLVVGEQYHLAFERAFDELDSPVELRSISKHRLAWRDVEFWRDDVIRELPHRSDAAEYSGREPTAVIGVRVKHRIAAPPQVSERDLRRWYEQRAAELEACGQASSGEDDWEAAKEQFPDRVTRTRVRSIRDEYAPAEWTKQGRRASRRAE